MRLLCFTLVLLFVGTILGLEFAENYNKLAVDYNERKEWITDLHDKDRGRMFLGEVIKECEERIAVGCIVPAIKNTLIDNVFTRVSATLLKTNVVSRLVYPTDMMGAVISLVVLVLLAFGGLVLYASYQKREAVNHIAFSLQDLKKATAKAKKETATATPQ